MDFENQRVLVTRPKHQSEEFGKQLENAGAVPIYLPVIEIHPVPDSTLLDRALEKLGCYDWVVFTSVNGVRAVWERLERLNLLPFSPKPKVAAIGPKTAEALNDNHIAPDFVPEEYIAEAILPGLGDLLGRWVLLPRADIARPALAEGIRAAGGFAFEIAAYLTLPGNPDESGIEAVQEGVDWITFTSSSTVRNFVALIRRYGLDPEHLPGQPKFACIGPITAGTALDEGLPVSLVAENYTIEGLLAALKKFAA